MTAVAGLHRERAPQRFVDPRVVGKAPRPGLQRRARQHLPGQIDAAGADVGLVIDDELRQRLRSIQRLVRVLRGPRRSQAVARKLPFAQLKQLGESPVEHLSVESRSATIGIIVEPISGGGLRVVVQGFMDGRLIPFIKNVALDGFYK